MPDFPAPLITVVTVSFNSAATIADTVRSVMAQAGVSVEHVIVDGGSTDATLAIARARGHVGPVISEPDQGIYDAMNKGLRAARGEYVGFLNSDDYFAGPTALSRLFGAMPQPAVDALWGNVMQVDAAGRPVRLVSGKWAAQHERRRVMMPPHPSFYARTELLRSIGGFTLKYPIAGDLDLLLRLFATTSFRGEFVDELVTVMRLGGASTGGLSSVTANYHEVMRAMQDNGHPPSHREIATRYVARALEVSWGAIARAKGERYPPSTL